MRKISTLIIVLFPILLQAQNLPLSQDLQIEYQLTHKTQLPLSTTAMSPWIYKVPDTIKRTQGSWFMRKLFREHLVAVDTADVKFTIDPLLNINGGYERIQGKKTWTNTRGFIIRGTLGEKLSFESTFLENQSEFPSYLDKFVRLNKIVPGSGAPKAFGNLAFDYEMASGYLSYTPSKFFNFQFGTGKNFIGEGYRSLILSDQSFDYPYLRITTSFWHFKYTNLYAQLQDLTEANGTHYWRKKYTTMHLLSWDVTKNFNIGLFEAVVWSAQDSLVQRGFEVNYLNPIIFLNPVETSLDSPDNMLMGFTYSYRINRTTLYGQIMLDEFRLKDVLAGDGWWANKQAFQIGVKSFEPFSIKGLFLLTEYNQARPFTFSYKNSIQNYGHYNQPLGDPLGANFREWVSMVRYQKRRWIGQAKLITAHYGKDVNNLNYGMNIFDSYNTHVQEYGNRIGQGLRTNLIYTDLQLRYIINPTIHFEFFGGMIYRNETNTSSTQRDNQIYIGLRTSIQNVYGDF